jgi:DNA mismatch repair ATPase MutS
MIRHPLRDPAAVSARQEAVREIAERAEVRGRALETLLPLRAVALDGLLGFFAEPLAFARRRWLVAWSDLMGTLAPFLLVLSAVTGDPRHVSLLVLAVVVNVVTLGLRIRALNLERSRVRLLAPMIQAWLGLDAALRVHGEWCPEWGRVRDSIGEVAPALRRLRSRVTLLQLHEFGILFELFNFLTLWELRVLPRASRLIDLNREPLLRALGAVGEIEALVSLSLPLVEQPDFELPEPLYGDSPALVAEQIGHPLLDPESAVRNSVSLGETARVLVVTGSNMAGKSTFLKSVGCNAVLAGAGGPVCARGFRWTPMDLHSDVNVRDSLDDGKSYFKVEVERVRQAILAAAASPFVLILFDELFRGTNSTERRAASRAIVRYLRDTGALTVIATHDHAMTTLATKDAEPAIENRHFQETIGEDGMTFDYRLRDGPATTRNAIRLLEISGYPEPIIREARAEAP